MIKSQITNQAGRPDGARHFKTGDIVEGVVVGKGRSAIYIDIGPQATGIIQGVEFSDEKAMLKNLNLGDTVRGKVIETENSEGYIELSIREAGRQLTWDRLKEMKAKEEIISVKITSVNKGGLMAEVLGVVAFLPVSQLAQEHYPKVEGGDTSKILKALQKFVDTELEVQVFDIDPKEQKIILSERSKERNKAREILSAYAVGDVVEGEITGVVDFGAFVRFPIEASDPAMQVEGLIHISEIDWQIIDDPSQFVKTGDRVAAKIIDLANGRASLSLKSLKEDPWKDIETKYKKLDTVNGKVTKLNPFGAFVEIEPRIQGLCHISEFGTKKKMDETLVAGETYTFQILDLNPVEHRMSLRVAQEAAK